MSSSRSGRAGRQQNTECHLLLKYDCPRTRKPCAMLLRCLRMGVAVRMAMCVRADDFGRIERVRSGVSVVDYRIHITIQHTPTIIIALFIDGYVISARDFRTKTLPNRPINRCLCSLVAAACVLDCLDNANYIYLSTVEPIRIGRPRDHRENCPPYTALWLI